MRGGGFPILDMFSGLVTSNGLVTNQQIRHPEAMLSFSLLSAIHNLCFESQTPYRNPHTLF